MTTQTITVEEDDEPEICSNCGYPAPLVEYEETNFAGYSGGEFEKVKYKFCDVCASTYLSRATSSPRQVGDQAMLFQSLGYIANMILDEVRKAKP